MQDFLAGLHHLAVHVLDQRIDVDLADFRFKVVAGALAARLLALDVLPAMPTFTSQRPPRTCAWLLQWPCGWNPRFFHVRNDPRVPDGFALPVTEDFDFSVFIATPDEAGDFRRADVQANDDFSWLFDAESMDVEVVSNTVGRLLDPHRSSRCACIVQVAPFDVFGVEYKEFVQFIFKLLGVAKSNARRSNRYHIERAGAVDFNLVDEGRPKRVVCGGLDQQCFRRGLE